MEELQNRVVEMLKGFSFKELEKMLNTQAVPEVRSSIMNAMELYHEEKFYKWLEEI